VVNNPCQYEDIGLAISENKTYVAPRSLTFGGISVYLLTRSFQLSPDYPVNIARADHSTDLVIQKVG